MISPFTALGIEGAKGYLLESLASPRASWLRGGGGGAGRTEQSVVFSPWQLILTSSADAKISEFTTNNANLAGDDAGDDVYCIPEWSGTDSQGFRVVLHGHHRAGAAKTGTSAKDPPS